MKLGQKEDEIDQKKILKNSSLYHNFSQLKLEIKMIYLKLFEENIQENIQLQNQKEKEKDNYKEKEEDYYKVKDNLENNQDNQKKNEKEKDKYLYNQIDIYKENQTDYKNDICKDNYKDNENSFAEHVNSEYNKYISDLQSFPHQSREYLVVFTQSLNKDETDNHDNTPDVNNKSNHKNIRILNQGDLEIYEQQNLFKKTIQMDIIQLNKKNIMVLKMFKIITYQDNQEIISERFSYFLQYKNEKSNYKYNQNISETEYQILNNPSKTLNTNIIDGYMNYLQIQDEMHYFSLPSIKREQYQRLILFPSSLISNCTLKNFNKNDEELIKKKFIYLFLEQIKQFSAIQYQFWLIYKKIGIVVNSSNFHWQFIEVKVEEKQLVLYDSLFTQLSPKVEFFFNTVFQVITRNQNFEFKVVRKQDFPKQKDGSSCGYFTCIAANYLSKIQTDQFSYYEYLENIRKDLQELFFPKK